MSFEFKQTNVAFRWESDFLALEFSNPFIQGYRDFIKLTSDDEILYYYYTVKIFKKAIGWDEDDNDVSTWELISERSTHDFPTITQLKEILKYQLKDDSSVDGQKITYMNDDVRYSKTMATDGFACDDFYEITKSTDEKGGIERYTVYCGTTFDSQGDLNSVGLRTPYVTQDDLEALLECVIRFIDYSLEEHNESVKLIADCYEVKDGKIYEYNAVDGMIDKNTIEAIYAVGDQVEVKTVVDNEEEDFRKSTITKIEGDTIFLDSEQIIQGSTIAYISNQPTTEMLNYKEDAIADEFIGVLSDEEKKEFRESSDKKLLEKYKMAIIDRTWMCRDEHSFNMDSKTGDRVVAVTPIVEEIIHVIKKKLES